MREKAGIELLLVEHYANLRKKTRKLEDACVYFFVQMQIGPSYNLLQAPPLLVYISCLFVNAV